MSVDEDCVRLHHQQYSKNLTWTKHIVLTLFQSREICRRLPTGACYSSFDVPLGEGFGSNNNNQEVRRALVGEFNAKCDNLLHPAHSGPSVDQLHPAPFPIFACWLSSSHMMSSIFFTFNPHPIPAPHIISTPPIPFIFLLIGVLQLSVAGRSKCSVWHA